MREIDQILKLIYENRRVPFLVSADGAQHPKSVSFGNCCMAASCWPFMDSDDKQIKFDALVSFYKGGKG